jgi:4-aminobutyrate aminotransferase/(S)-3-amino-2-methylpropionate transaminase
MTVINTASVKQTVAWSQYSTAHYVYIKVTGCFYNSGSEMNCLQVEDLFIQFSKKGRPVAGIVVEPIQAEGGDNEASPHFFQELQRIAKQVWL